MNQLSVHRVPEIIERNFPLSISSNLAAFPLEAQDEFLQRYKREMKVLGLAYVLHIFFGASYLYEEKWFKQILFWLTGFGFIIGWVVNCFRLPNMIRRTNRKIAQRIIGQLRQKYNVPYPNTIRDSRSFIRQKQGLIYAAPRNIKPEADPTDLQAVHLEKGYMVDHDLKTWDVTAETQCDWHNGSSERELTLCHDLEKAYLLIRSEAGFDQLLKFEPVNLYALDNRIGQEIALRNRPANVIEYKGKQFYRENQLEGVCFDMPHQAPGEKVTVWEYLDDNRKEILRIERRGRENFKAMKGQPIQEWEFSEILPRKVTN